MQSQVKVFDHPKDETESVPLTFDFSAALPVGVTLSGAPTVGVTTSGGIDPNPSAILNGAPAFDSTKSKVLIPVTGGVNGVMYRFVVNCPTTAATLSPTIIADLQVNR